MRIAAALPLALGLLLLAGRAQAATYYVDFSSGSDGNAGTSQALPFKHCPGDSAASGTAAATKLAAGDLVRFKGGVAYQGTVTVGWSGAAGAPIVYDGNAAGSWGTGRAIIDGQGTRQVGFQSSGKSYFVIDSFIIKSFSKAVSSVGVSVDGGSHAEVRGCQISDVYYAKNPGGTSWEQQRGVGIVFSNHSYGEAHHNLIRDVGSCGINVNASSGASVTGGKVHHNEVTNMNTGLRITMGNATAGTHMADLQVYANYIHDFDQYYVSNAWHRDGIHVWARPETASLTIDNVEIYGNYFEDHTSAEGSTAWIYLEYACRNFKIHHNILHDPRAYFGIRILGDGFLVAGNHEISNNIIYNVALGYGLHVQESTGLKLYNNVFYTSSFAYSIATDSMSGFASDYNLFFLSTGTQVAALNAGPANNIGGTRYTLAELQTKTSHDKNSLYGDPKFALAVSGIDADPLGFKPTQASPTRDKGTSRGFAVDYLGVPIPQGTAPDIGAFEYTTITHWDGAVKKDGLAAKDGPGPLLDQWRGEGPPPVPLDAAASGEGGRRASDGCGCRVGGQPPSAPGLLLLLLAVLGATTSARARNRR